jgi:tetratricopeptide (TPR) repeat protein
LARLEFTEGHHDKAESAVEALQKEFGKRTESSYLLGEIALAQAQPEVAQQYYMSAFQIDKNNTDAIARLYELSVQGVGSQAFTDAMESSMKESSLPAPAVKLLADTYLIQGKTALAALYYEKLLELPEFTDNPDVLNNLANIYATKNLDKALATALKGVEATTEPSSALLDTVGWILAQQDENEKALSYLRKAYAQNSTDPEIRYHTGATLLALDRTAEAETELRAAIDSGKQFTGREDAERLLASIPEPTTER